MSYRDDFYKKDNIIGYTGDLTQTPTVYFADAGGLRPRTKTVDGKEQVMVTFGHITQAHDKADNVGREKLRDAWSYGIVNVTDGKGRTQAKEFMLGIEWEERGGNTDKDEDEYHVFHTSRGKYEQATNGNVDILARAITNFTELKTRYDKK